jgi:hypothetical protein
MDEVGCAERRNKMIPHPYIREEFALEHRQQLLHEAEQERIVANVPKRPSSSLQRLAGRLGIALIGLGTRLQRLEQSSRVIEYHAKPCSCMDE